MDENEEGHGNHAEDFTIPEPDNTVGGMGKTETEMAPGARGENAQQGDSRTNTIASGWFRMSNPGYRPLDLFMI